LHLYTNNFEKDFLAHTEKWYRSQSTSYLSSQPLTEYLKIVQEWLEEEEGRIKRYLHPTTQKYLIPLCETLLLSNHSKMIQDQFKPLLEREKASDLERMYILLSRVPDTLSVLRDTFQQHVLEKGLLAVKVAAQTLINSSAVGLDKKTELDPKVYCDALLGVYTKFSSLAVENFKGEAGFNASLDKACREFVNRNAVCSAGSSKSAELLAKYTDTILRKISKSNEDEEMEVLLNGVVRLSNP
jgi:cullin 1